LAAVRASTRDADAVVIGPIRSSLHASVSDAFEEACTQVGKQLGAYVSTDWKRAQPLPSGDTFDLARKAAHDQGKTAIYLLFDEAQALFRRRGRETAERLKVLIETAWGVAQPGMAPIRIGLVGQLHLPRMIQGQLEGMFAQTIQKLDIDPQQIQRLLRESTRDVMQSTSDARQMLSRVSRNLYILKLLLAEIRRTLIQEQRTWFLRTDVERAVTALIDQAIQTSSTQLVSYLRDALNGSYDLTLWQPGPAYLVAVAWAVALVDAGDAAPARLERTRELIEQWARQITPRSSVPKHRIEECLRDLHDLAVLDERDRFRSELLARYFLKLGRGAFPLRDDAERQAMQKLLVDVVALPELMEQIGSGGQAKVYYSDSSEREEAIRVVELPNDASRVAFVETCYALKAIEGTRSRHAGYLSLPVVRQAGLALDGGSDDQQLRGAVKYDWVSGSDLTSRKRALDDAAVVAIGRAMAEALTVLEQRGVVHRDVRLENIVIGHGGIPVLVDFGLARLADHMTHTRVFDTGYLAPEVNTDPPQWTSQSDVFALGVTLRNLRQSDDASSPLGRVLALAMEPDPSRRLTPARLAGELAALSDRLDLETTRKRIEASYHKKLQRFPSNLRWARLVGSNYLPDMIASALGVFGDQESLLCSASFLDDLFAAWYVDQYNGAKPPHISSLDASQLPPSLHVFCHPDIIATGFLRHGRAHREKQRRLIDQALHRLNLHGAPHPVTHLRKAVLSASARFEREMPLPGLHDLLRDWLAPRA
jgi:serine/threonine protein kinase